MPSLPDTFFQAPLTLQPASLYAIGQLTHAFNRGFEGYLIPFTQTPDSLQRMIDDNDVRLDASLVAVAPDDELVGVGLLAVRNDPARDTTGLRGWIAGMGIAPAWRSRGQGATLLHALIAQARELGAAHVQLEVLTENTPARKLYTRLGFTETRALTVYTGPARLPKRFQAPAASYQQITVEQALTDFAAFHLERPSWQREQATLAHMATRLEAVGMLDDSGLRAYALVSRQPTGYAILDLGARASAAAARRTDALALVGELLRRFPGAMLRAINIVPGEPLGAALRAVHCPMAATQREMVLPLTLA